MVSLRSNNEEISVTLVNTTEIPLMQTQKQLSI